MSAVQEELREEVCACDTCVGPNRRHFRRPEKRALPFYCSLVPVTSRFTTETRHEHDVLSEITSDMFVTSTFVSKTVTQSQYNIMDVSNFDIGDTVENTVDKVNIMNERLRKNGRPILLHSSQGKNFAPFVAIAWLLNRDRMTGEETIDYVMNKRPCIDISLESCLMIQKLERHFASDE